MVLGMTFCKMDSRMKNSALKTVVLDREMIEMVNLVSEIVGMIPDVKTYTYLFLN